MLLRSIIESIYSDYFYRAALTRFTVNGRDNIPEYLYEKLCTTCIFCMTCLQCLLVLAKVAK